MCYNPGGHSHRKVCRQAQTERPPSFNLEDIGKTPAFLVTYRKDPMCASKYRIDPQHLQKFNSYPMILTKNIHFDSNSGQNCHFLPLFLLFCWKIIQNRPPIFAHLYRYSLHLPVRSKPIPILFGGQCPPPPGVTILNNKCIIIQGFTPRRWRISQLEKHGLYELDS